jgi:hypothetical protein
MDPPQYPWFMESFKGAVVSRLLVAAVAMLVLVGVLAAGALTPMSRSEAESLFSGIEETSLNSGRESRRHLLE